MKTESSPELTLTKIDAHAEGRLLAYHLQNPGILPYHYFGGPKLSCHACGTLFSAFNNLNVAKSFDHPRFLTKGCNNKLYLQWPCPSLLSQEQQQQLDANVHSLDIQVREEMNKILGNELLAYVGELRQAIEVSTPSPSDSTSASGDSPELVDHCLNMKMILKEFGM